MNVLNEDNVLMDMQCLYQEHVMAVLSGWRIELSRDPDVECLNLVRVNVLHTTVWGTGVQEYR